MYKAGLYFILSFITLAIACGGDDKKNDDNNETEENVPKVEVGEMFIKVFAPQANDLIDSTAEIEVLTESIHWAEGPVWVEDLNAVLFSDVNKNTIYKWSETDSLQVYLENSGYTGEEKDKHHAGSNGLALDSEGDLVLCQHGDRKVVLMNAILMEPKAQYISLAEQFNEKQYNSPNDLVVDSMGNIYFTDPPYGFKEKKPAELGVSGIYRIDINGEITSQLIDSIKFPNGITLSNDEKTLFVSNSDPKNAVIYSYEISEDKKLVSGKVFFDANELTKTGVGLPDGMKVHKSGNIFATGPGGVLVLSPEGQHLATISTGRATSNCALDSNQEYLYITAHNALIRVKLK